MAELLDHLVGAGAGWPVVRHVELPPAYRVFL